MFHFLETSADPIRMTFYLLAWPILLPSDVRAQEAVSICLERAQKATLAEHPHPVQQAAAKVCRLGKTIHDYSGPYSPSPFPTAARQFR